MTGAHTSGQEPLPGLTPVASYGPPPSLALTTSGFAGTMLVMVSLFQILQGIATVAADTLYVTGVEYVYQLDVTTWGWIHIAVGAIAIATGIGVLAGQTWGHLAGLCWPSYPASRTLHSCLITPYGARLFLPSTWP